jgi:hypothetical protein
VIRDASYQMSIYTEELKDIYISAERLKWQEELENAFDSDISREQFGELRARFQRLNQFVSGAAEVRCPLREIGMKLGW